MSNKKINGEAGYLFTLAINIKTKKAQRHEVLKITSCF